MLPPNSHKSNKVLLKAQKMTSSLENLLRPKSNKIIKKKVVIKEQKELKDTPKPLFRNMESKVILI